MSTSDRIEKSVVLRAAQARVWRALTQVEEFGSWFGMELDGPFVAGETLTGRIVPTTVDPEVAKLQAPHRGKPVLLVVEAIEPMRRFAFRWHPYAIDPAVDYAKEPMTLVSFELEAVEGGTRLRLTESGFDEVPRERRAAAFAANEGGWAKQMELIAGYLAEHG